MRLALSILIALAPLAAQVPQPVSAGSHDIGAARVSLVALSQVSRGFDREFQNFAPADPIDVLGRTRGIYLDGYGVIFSTELSPIVTPNVSPFRPNISDQDRAAVRQRKVARLPAVEKLIDSMLQSAARELAALPEDQQIVVAVKFLYLPYEDTNGLPGQYVVRATRRAIASGAPVTAMVTNQ
jgi:hypothetical protein